MKCIGFYITELEFKLEEIKDQYGLEIAFFWFIILLFFVDSLKIVLMGH